MSVLKDFINETLYRAYYGDKSIDVIQPTDDTARIAGAKHLSEELPDHVDPRQVRVEKLTSGGGSLEFDNKRKVKLHRVEVSQLPYKLRQTIAMNSSRTDMEVLQDDEWLTYFWNEDMQDAKVIMPNQPTVALSLAGTNINNQIKDILS